jgi:hypothetical protein
MRLVSRLLNSFKLTNVKGNNLLDFLIVLQIESVVTLHLKVGGKN